MLGLRRIEQWMLLQVADQGCVAQRRARLIAFLSVGLMLAAAFFASLHFLIGREAEALRIAVAFPLLLLSLPVLRFTHSTEVAGAWLAAVVLLMLTSVASTAGGTLAPPLVWVAPLPVFALVLAGRQVSSAYLVAAVAVLIAFPVLELSGLLITPEVGDLDGKIMLTASRLVMMLVLLASVRQMDKIQATAADQLRDANSRLLGEIDEHEATRKELDATHRELVRAAHVAGMSEVATSVLHNVGNALTSVVVSSQLLQERAQQPQSQGLARLGELLGKHESELEQALGPSKAHLIAEYVTTLVQKLDEESEALRDEAGRIASGLGHIRGIVAKQESFATRRAMLEKLSVDELVDDAVVLAFADEPSAAEFNVTRTLGPLPAMLLDRHKVLTILVNLLTNAREAKQIASGEPRIRLKTREEPEGMLRIEVEDDGVGIAPEDVDRIFGFGFTTKSSEHGFGLHACATTVMELGGHIEAASPGLGQGARLVVSLPIVHA